MVSLGRKLIVLNRFYKRKDGIVCNYPLRMWVEVLEYARVGVWEYIYADYDRVFKRVYTGRNSTAGWVNCPELCAFYRKHAFKPTEKPVQEVNDNAAV